MGYAYAAALRTVLINGLDQFQSDDSGSNLGYGWTGWDEASAYARLNDLDYFGSVFMVTGDDQMLKAFDYGMWQWAYYVRMHVRFEVNYGTTSPDVKAATLADDFMDVMLNSDNLRTIAPSGNVKVASANYLGNPETVNDYTYLTVEFLVSVKEQISRS